MVAVLAVVPATSVGAAAGPVSAGSSAVVRDWERIAISTIYGPPELPVRTPIPVGVIYMGFTSLAMYRAAEAADRQHGSPVAAIARAAHDVLAEYVPSQKADLAEELADSLAGVPDGVAERRGVDAGARVAHQLIASRAHDGRNDTSIVYQREPAPGVWQPAPGGQMLVAWLGFVRPLVLTKPIRAAGVTGPDPLTSTAYAAQYNEVRVTGSATATADERTPGQTDTALFFNSNSAVMVSEALVRYLDTRPRSLSETARLFAVIHTAMSDALITCWRLKYDVGFWRPFQAIHGADTDGNPATTPDPGWAPLIANPPYSDYVSGHGCLTSPAVQTIRRLLGENTTLTLHSYNTKADRTYTTLGAIEHDAFHARIWGGLHFRTAMEDAYAIGHEAANQILRKLR
jgi:hypothetical protein